MSKDFMQRVKEAWPNYPTLYEKIEQGNPYAIEYMNQNDINFVTFDEVWAATTLKELQNLAKKREEQMKQREILRNEWMAKHPR